jgi:ubiquitin carboxyl-terminal hydrolase 36/42
MDRQDFLNLNFFNDRLAKNPKAFPFRYGLSNLGNTCFMNSILNCLFGDLELNQLVQNPHHFDAYSRDDRLRFMKHFANLIRAASSNKPDVIKIAIENFVKMVRWDTRDVNLFPAGQQADAHEFLVYLIRRLKEQLDLVLPSLYPHQDRFQTIFDEFQVGISQVTCCEWNHCSQTYIREMLSLDIENNNNIQECLSEYFRPVNFMRCICSSNGHGHNGLNRTCNPFRCDQCDMYVGATKTLTINYLPSILILHLKRFRFDSLSGQVY